MKAILCILTLLATPCLCRSQSPSAARCTVEKSVTTCDWPAFAALLRVSNTVAVDFPRLEPHTGAQLEALVRKLGKALPSSDSPAQLTVTAEPVDSSGFRGEADTELVALKFYRGAPTDNHLVWVETFYGQAGHPWAANVNDAIEQFCERLKKELEQQHAIAVAEEMVALLHGVMVSTQHVLAPGKGAH